MIDRFVANPRLLILSVAFLLVAGLVAVKTMPRLEDPRISNRVALVLTPFPGASAERVEALVTEPIENRLREIPELLHVTSESRPGISMVVMQISDAVYEPDDALVWSRARDKIAEVVPDLPEGVLPPRLDERLGHALTVLVSLRWTGDGKPSMAVLGRYARELESRLWGLDGTDYVELAGDAPEEIRVTLDPARAAVMGLGFDQIGQKILESDAKKAAGEVQGPQFEAIVEVAGELDSVERVRRIKIASSGGGRQLQLGDIATVERMVADPPPDIALIDGERAVVIGVRMRPDHSVDSWTSQLEELLVRFSADVPANIKAEVVFSQNEYVDSRLMQLVGNLLYGLALIVLVLVVSMGWRSALVVALALPLMISFTLFCLWAAGLEIHQMTIAGIIISLGIMVDNAIVMSDTVRQRLQSGEPMLRSVAGAVRHLRLPLFGSTVTTILGFTPIVLVPGPPREFAGPIGITVIVSLVGSYLIAHSIVAALAGRFSCVAAPGRGHWFQTGLFTPRVAMRFRGSLHRALQRPLLAAAVLMVLPIVGYLSSMTLEDQFFPSANRDMINLELYLAEPSSLAATERVVRRASAELRTSEGVEHVSWFVGRSAPPYYYNLLRRRDGMQNFAQAMIKVRDAETAERLIPELQAKFDERFPEAQILVRKLQQGPNYNAPIELRLYGHGLGVLREKGEELRRIALETPDVLHARATLTEAVPKAWLDVSDERVNLSGLSLVELSRQLQAALEGVRKGSLTEETEDIPVRVRVNRETRRGVSELYAMQFVPKGERPESAYGGIPLAALGNLHLEPSRGTIPRRDGRRINTIEVYASEGVLASVVLARIRDAMAQNQFRLPAGYSIELGGEYAERNKAVGELSAYGGLLAIILVIVLVTSFDSFRLGGLIFVIGILSVGLGVLAAALTGSAFGFMVLVSLMGLMGLAINASIVIIAELKSDAAAVRGDADATVEAVARCGRHIVATTLTTFLGLMPLALQGDGFFSAFAIPMACGTVFATMLSVYFAPVAFKALAQRRAFRPTPG